MDEEKELEKLKKERDEYLDGWKRAKADFLNYKKEQRERIEILAAYANEELLQDVLSVLDNLERAEENIPGKKKNDQTIKGFMQIAGQVREFLKNQGVEELEAEGKEFNPEFHEALAEVEVKGKKSGEIAEVVEKGYTWRGRLLRAAKVRVVK